MHKHALQGRSVIIVGAGLAGLTAAVRMEEEGAKVRVVEAQERVGGRVLTIRGAFARAQHAEAGADFIDEEQQEIRRLAADHGLCLEPVLRQGFFFRDQGKSSSRRVRTVPGQQAWAKLAAALSPLVRVYRLADERWDSAVMQEMASRPVSQWLDEVGADPELRARVRGLRGFFLAEPGELSLLALVEQLASDVPGQRSMYRIEGGNDRLPAALAERLGDALHLRTIAKAVRQHGTSIRLTVETLSGASAQMTTDYLLFAIPATTLRSISIRPPLPAGQRKAIAGLKYGRVTKSLLQFDRRFWTGNGRPRAYGTDAPTGAIWDGNEEQRGRVGILTLMAGGQASEDTRNIVSRQGIPGLVHSLDWLGAGHATLLQSRLITWEDDPWAQGGYAYFDPSYDPALRQWLARPRGRILFAGEHTSLKWQGYMNGAVESALRAVEELKVLVSRES